jgi:DNA repair ATPase RecN
MSQELEMRITAKVDEALAAIRQLGDRVEGAFSQIEKANERVVEAQRLMVGSTRDVITGLSGVATASFSLYNAFDRVRDMQVSVDRANLQVKQSLNSLEDAQRRYNAAVAKYGAFSEQAQAALSDLQVAQERYNVAVERAEMMQKNLNKAMAQSSFTNDSHAYNNG